MIGIVAAASLLTLAVAFPQERFSEESKCGYDSCPAPVPGKINVHLVPHTHDDVGWLKTVDQYYFGSKTNIQNAGVQYILDSVVNELLHDPKKKFIYVETAFFWKWWNEQEDHMKHRVKQLVRNGQLEFIGGAWSMNDEATTHYHSVIDQFTWGFRKLNDTFGRCGRPRIGWQIDPFGHSRETAAMMAQFGFDGLFFGRLDYQDKNLRLKSQTMEMIWEGNPSLGSSGDLATVALYNQYSAPKEFCFDILCADDPIVDDRSSPEFNLDQKVDNFLRFATEQWLYYKTENVLVTFGMDFHYQFAHKNFKNMDKLIRYFWAEAERRKGIGVGLGVVLISRRHPSPTPNQLTDLTRSAGDLLTGGLYNHYSAPPGFCFDVLCEDDPLVSDPKSPDYNVEKKVTRFLDFVKNQASRFITNNIVLTMGDDFNYQDAHKYFKNLDLLIRYVNERQKTGSNINVFYSTPSCYVKSLNDANMTWPTKQDDFFPYASDPHAYWTGYFTSRPTLKYFERQGNNLLQVCKQLSSLALLGPEDNPGIDALREAMGVMQHHDAITGTEKQHVADDYARILTKAIKECEAVSSAGLNKLMTKGDPSVPPLTFASCPLTNISECSLSTTSKKFVVTVYNPLSRPVNYIVRLPISDKSYSVKNPDGSEVLTQVVPIPLSLQNIPGRTSTSYLELVFTASDVPPLGYRSYYVSALQSDVEPQKESLSNLEQIELGFDDEQVTVNASTGLLSSITFDGHRIETSQTLEYYIGFTGSNSIFEYRASGAYIFRPKGNQSVPIATEANVTVYRGPLVVELHQTFSDWASQIIRRYNNERYMEVEWLVGPIPVEDNDGKEVISRLKTNINSKGKFYTDSNGRQTLERQRNFRPTWELSLKEPVSGNYYPVTTDISINDGKVELTIITDRAQGGSSLRDGEVEMMLHRRLLFDDGFGVGEALNEKAYEKGLVARGRHWVLLGNMSDPNWPKRKRLLQQEKVLSPQIILTDATRLDFDRWSKTYRTTYSGLNEALPPEVQILTLEPWQGRTYLLRLEHLLAKSESDQKVAVDLSKLFSAFDIVSVRETSLGADRWLNEVNRLRWRKESNEVLEEAEPETTGDSSFPQVVLRPKEIRTFVCEIKPKRAI